MSPAAHPTEADRAADFAAAVIVEAVTWARLEWWTTSDGATAVAITPACESTNEITTFATIWH
jgi:hypothetical protein